MTAFSPGDPVKLTDRFAKAIQRNRTINWKARRGVVKACNSRDVFILWEGRKSNDQYPIKAVEKINSVVTAFPEMQKRMRTKRDEQEATRGATCKIGTTQDGNSGGLSSSIGGENRIR